MAGLESIGACVEKLAGELAGSSSNLAGALQQAMGTMQGMSQAMNVLVADAVHIEITPLRPLEGNRVKVRITLHNTSSAFGLSSVQIVLGARALSSQNGLARKIEKSGEGGLVIGEMMEEGEEGEAEWAEVGVVDLEPGARVGLEVGVERGDGGWVVEGGQVNLVVEARFASPGTGERLVARTISGLYTLHQADVVAEEAGEGPCVVVLVGSESHAAILRDALGISPWDGLGPCYRLTWPSGLSLSLSLSPAAEMGTESGVREGDGGGEGGEIGLKVASELGALGLHLATSI